MVNYKFPSRTAFSDSMPKIANECHVLTVLFLSRQVRKPLSLLRNDDVGMLRFVSSASPSKEVGSTMFQWNKPHPHKSFRTSLKGILVV